MEDWERYGDIIDYPYEKQKLGGMPLLERAAQFAPFAALTGHGAAIAETARYTEAKRELDEEEKELLDMKLAALQDCLALEPQVSITYFVPDEKKQGGRYRTVECVLAKLDSCRKILVTTENELSPWQDIVAVEANILGDEF